MTDNEIIKALERCRDSNCICCPNQGGCVENIFVETLNLIYQKDIEIEKIKQLREPIELGGYRVEDGKIVFRAELIGKPCVKKFGSLDEIVTELNEMLKNAYEQNNTIGYLKCQLRFVKSDTLNEFIKRLKDNQENTTMDKQIVSVDLIETILKEMTEE